MDRELFLLGILREQAMHGYQVAEIIEHSLGPSQRLRRSTTYFLLERMAEQGWLDAVEDQQGSRPPRRIYHVTPAGENTFQRLLRASLSRFTLPIPEGDLSLAFLDQLAPEEARDLLAQRQSEIQRLLDHLRTAAPHPEGLRLILEHRVQLLQGELDWMDELLSRMQH